MGRAHLFDEIACQIVGMDRRTIARNLRTFRAPFPVDLTPEFIASTDLDKLRHIYLALCLQARQMPRVEHEQEDDRHDPALEQVA